MLTKRNYRPAMGYDLAIHTFTRHGVEVKMEKLSYAGDYSSWKCHACGKELYALGMAKHRMMHFNRPETIK